MDGKGLRADSGAKERLNMPKPIFDYLYSLREDFIWLTLVVSIVFPLIMSFIFSVYDYSITRHIGFSCLIISAFIFFSLIVFFGTPFNDHCRYNYFQIFISVFFFSVAMISALFLAKGLISDSFDNPIFLLLGAVAAMLFSSIVSGVLIIVRKFS